MSYSGTISAEYGGFWRRVGAALIDAVILWLLQLALSPVTGALLPDMASLADPALEPEAFWMSFGPSFALIWIVSTIPGLVYVVGMTASPWQATLGKVALGMQVVTLDGQRLTVLRSFGRYLAQFPSALILGIGFLMVGWTARKQGLHDMIAGTLVVKKGSMAQSNVF